MEGSRIDLERPIADAISRIRFAPRSNRLLISSWDSVRDPPISYLLPISRRQRGGRSQRVTSRCSFLSLLQVLRLYDTDRSEISSEAPSEGSALLDCCFEDENAAFAACSDGCIRRFEFCSRVQDIMSRHDDASTCVEYSVEAGLLISAGLDKKLIFQDVRLPERESGHSIVMCSEIESLSLCDFSLIGASGRSVNIYDLRNLKGPVQSKESSLEYQISCVQSFSSSEGYVAGSIDGHVVLEFFDPMKAKELSCIFRCRPISKGKREHLVGVNDIEFHPSHDTFVTGDNEGYTIMWDAQSRKRLLEFPRYPNSVSSLSYNNGGHKLAVAISCTYQEANELEEPREVFVYEAEDLVSSSKEKSC